ncbi:MAG TPA: phage Gp37/Gp68 family protein [Polyangiaceae bacterium]|nr:phage Gp37/Gp68 family protein [Polyangiaceae bacterium]
MSDGSAIEWTDATWNPVRGCTKISPGCKHCYAQTFSERFRGVPGHPFEQGFDLRLVETALELPVRWRSPRRIFVNSMSDLFHEEVPEDFIRRVFDVMSRASQHQFQLLTKRSKRMAEIAGRLQIPRNVWMGVSVENERYVRRLGELRTVNAAVRFVSVEPLLGPIRHLPLDGIHWVIVGGESGPRARPMNPVWVRAIREQCQAAGVAFFFKQWGGVQKSRTGRVLDGRTWNEMPEYKLQLVSKERSLAVVNG